MVDFRFLPRAYRPLRSLPDVARSSGPVERIAARTLPSAGAPPRLVAAGPVPGTHPIPGVRPMPVPLQITIRGMEPSETVENLVRMHMSRLDGFSDRVSHCHVTVEAPTLRHAQGGHFRVHVELTLPGKDVVARRDPTKHVGNADIGIAIKEAFKAARRQLIGLEDRKRASRHEEGAA